MSASLAILQTSTSRGSLAEDLNHESEGKGSPFLNCVVSIWVLSVSGGLYKGLARMDWGTFFPRLPVCQRWGAGGGGLKLFGQCPYRTKTFKKRDSITTLTCFQQKEPPTWPQQTPTI